MRILAAMSGGVDSAVAAARMVASGHEVVGIHLALSKTPETLRNGSRGCCSLEDSADARRVADMLGISFYVWDFSELFQTEVIDDFISTYASGNTPNPCIKCNQKIKFAALADKAVALGYDAIVTGHYARLVDGKLYRAVDSTKDQSYVLASLLPEQLAKTLFPIGDTVKSEIRAEAAKLGLRVAEKPDSHDICFIPSGNTQVFLGETIGVRKGDIVDAQTGVKLASHSGVHGFTIGQRKGLGLPGPAADGGPRFVTRINAERNVIEVGPKNLLEVNFIVAKNPIILAADLDLTDLDIEIQIRAHGESVPARAELIKIVPNKSELNIYLKQSLWAVAPGQTVVLYLPDLIKGDMVIGSGIIDRTYFK